MMPKWRRKTSADKRTWTFMALIFEPNAREKLLECLVRCAKKLPSSSRRRRLLHRRRRLHKSTTRRPRTSSLLELNRRPSRSDPSIEEVPLTPAAEADVKRALLVGNFDAAVEGCFKNGA